uniref:TatD DNase family protein n=1 Tax=Candidatus Kentrum sp. SD TaxID=2126332 RepID=A0A450YIW9_9GAMM|nr:MAG: TatD DNase family protein [Candidatus Kentron sp. SD]VFK41530.1 MAG: TatD DNase family protein [Candidatus Kentron sp. SD]VFK78511.1 MAG: TatD DNase family protein [Candidatus Kentron sp. SD]
MLVDSHCHLDLAAKGGDPTPFVEDANRAGVDSLLSVAIDLASAQNAIHYAHRFPGVFASVGVHPNARLGAEPTVEELVILARDEKVIAIGETGLDTYRSKDSKTDPAGISKQQKARFRSHIRAAKQIRKPLIIHCRDAREDTLRILREEDASQVGGIMHCFVEDWETARKALDLGFYLSFSGIVTYKNAAIVKDSAKKAPMDRILVETDSPYLAPVPHRGKQNRPAYVHHVALHIAELRGMSFEPFARATTENFFRLFPHASGIDAPGTEKRE